ncbi:MAG: rRNA pseudouridine synthase [Firmicutes bacterium]|nr:rRNA pseudouridine synthase [Bacillota bacterium]MDY3659048.1 pseudouridine synthase [Eubacteriales bacterium]
MRLNKFLSTSGVCSRRKADELIENGEIVVNGKVETRLGANIDEKKDKVVCKGKEVVLTNDFVYYKLNKPKGYICSNDDEKDRKTIFELLPKDKRLFSVGRLDYNTEGVILVTNDGQLAEAISHPRYEVNKEYVATIEGKILESELAVLRAGVVENGKRMPKARVQRLETDGKTTKVSVIINEGQNRQVRRMFEAIGKTIVLLKRVRVGEITLGGLKRGGYKELNAIEMAYVDMLKN